MATVIHTEQLAKFYGRRRGLDSLDLEVGSGEIYGFLGPNGSGKTTTIRILLDLIRPSGGRAEVFGHVPRDIGAALRRRIGFLPGDFIVDGGQTSRRLLEHLAYLRGGLPDARIAQLAERLDLDLDAQIGSLSRGNRQKLGVIQAFMHEPELLVLDEPTTGLDPLLQQTFLAMAREARHAGQTVFMSSHVLSEVQQSADRVGIIRDGRMVAVESVQSLRRRAVRRVEVQFDGPVDGAEFERLPGVTEVVVEGATLRCRSTGRADELIKAAARHTIDSLTISEPDLEELFVGYYQGNGARSDEAAPNA